MTDHPLTLIDRAVDGAVAMRASAAGGLLTVADRAAAKKASERRIAGFPIVSEKQEREALDVLISARMAALLTFKQDRDRASALCAEHKLTPLAILPTGVWYHLVAEQGLYRLEPDAQSRLQRSSIFEVRVALSELDKWAAANWAAFIGQMFPTKIARAPELWKGQPNNQPLVVTLRLPSPPADVAETIAKASELPGVVLRVVAEANAVGFDQLPSEMYAGYEQVIENKRRADIMEAARLAILTRLRNDPIVHGAVGNASIIFAQFGDFPIEKAIVARVIAGDKVIPDGPLAASIGGYITNIADLYPRLASA